jgi:hypothetical protein
MPLLDWPLLDWAVLVPPKAAAGPPALLPVPKLPGEAAEPEGACGAALVAPVGAGEVWAAAMPAVMMIAAEASQMERMMGISC